MAIAAREAISPATLLTLGRVSNLPTVWTNVLTGAVLGGGDWRSWNFGVILVAISLFYVGGMFLNDYFDRAIDARERPERPIPSGAIAARTVATIGFGLLGTGFILTAPMGLAAIAMAALLAAAIVVYNFRHKGNPGGPIVMGACRALVYCTSAAALTGSIPIFVFMWAGAIAAYVAGITYAARQENLDRVANLWPLVLLVAPMVITVEVFHRGLGSIAIYLSLVAWIATAVYLLARGAAVGSVSRAVGWLIAGISLGDATILASADMITPALAAIGGFLVTLVAQKYIAGT
jgi:4-hydroxybenzoate polyprenyltransferase